MNAPATLPAKDKAKGKARPKAAAVPVDPPSEIYTYTDALTPPTPVAETFVPIDDADDAYPHVSRRQDGWSAHNQRRFLEAIAEGFGVEAACMRVGLSMSSAYAFRRTAKGAAFSLAWRAATLLARDSIAETLYVRAIEGQVDTYTRADGSTVTRHRHDNRLAMSLLARLDRQVEAAPDADVRAARLVAQEFDGFLDLLARDASAAHAGLFLARRAGDLGVEDPRDLAPVLALATADRLVRTGVATAAEVDVSDLDPAARTSWTGEQWARAEAAGLVAIATPAPPPPAPESAPAVQQVQHSPETEQTNEPVWWCEVAQDWRTAFPPPLDFTGWEDGEFGDPDYEREPSPDERELLDAQAMTAALAEVGDRDAWFADLARQVEEEAAPAPQPG